MHAIRKIARPPSIAGMLCLLLAFSVLAPPAAAAAYIDPTSGSIMLQVAAASLLAAAYTLRRWWGHAGHLLRTVWSRLTGR